MQKELEIIEATKDKRSVVDLKIDDKPVGRLVVNRNKQYEFNLQTEIDKKKLLSLLCITETRTIRKQQLIGLFGISKYFLFA